MGIGEIFTSVKATWAGITAAIKIRDDVKLGQLQLQMTDQLLELYTAAVSLAIDNGTLAASEREAKEALMELQRKTDEAAKYELFQPHPGTTVYRYKSTDGDGQPMHYVCPACLDNKSVKSMIQFNGSEQAIGVCYSCDKGYRFRDTPTAPRRRINHDPF